MFICPLLLVLYSLYMQSSNGLKSSPTHLIIVAHGLVGRAKDLDYVVRQIQVKDGERAFVHATRVNEGGKTYDGVESGSKRIAKDVIELIENNKENNLHNLKYISFIGNSLGGLYVRHVISILYDTMTGLIAGLEPLNFISIATPHLGFESFYDFPPKSLLNFIMHNFIGQTGFDLNLTDEDRLLYHMATSHKFLSPLKAFQRRRLYANLNGDFMVPFNTASIYERFHLRDNNIDVSSKAAIVHIVPEKGNHKILEYETEERNPNYNQNQKNQMVIAEGCIEKEMIKTDNKESKNNTQKNEIDEKEALIEKMRHTLNPLFEKVIVNFPSSSFIPLSHNKIAAIEREGPVSNLIASICGFNEGTFVMDDLANYVTRINI